MEIYIKKKKTCTIRSTPNNNILKLCYVKGAAFAYQTYDC